MNIQKALNWRYATKQFDPEKKISNTQLNQILESAHQAPSSLNIQPWKLFLIEDKELRKQIQTVAYNQPQIVDASHLIIVTAKKDLIETDINHLVEITQAQRSLSTEQTQGFEQMLNAYLNNMPKEMILPWSQRQTYIALGFMLYTAALLEIDACPMEGFEPEKVDQVLGLKELGLKATSILALGYRSADDKYAKEPKVRFDLDEILIRK